MQKGEFVADLQQRGLPTHRVDDAIVNHSDESGDDPGRDLQCSTPDFKDINGGSSEESLTGILIIGARNEFTCGIALRGDDEFQRIVADIQHISGGAVWGRRQEGVRAYLHINWPLDEPQKFISITGEYRTSTASLIVPGIEMTDPSSKRRTDCGDGVRRMGVAQPVNRSGGVDAGALGRLFDNKIDGTLGQWIPGLPSGLEHRRRRRRIAAVGKQAGGDRRGDQHLAALTALADDRELCLPQPDSNLTATRQSGFSPIGGPSAGWLLFHLRSECGLRLGVGASASRRGSCHG